MATLTADEIAIIRLDIGDGCSTITDPQIQAAWDAAGGDKCKAYAQIAWWLLVKQKPDTFNLTNGGTAVGTATIRAYQARYDHWADCAGIGGGTLTAGSLNLGIDARPTDEWQLSDSP